MTSQRSRGRNYLPPCPPRDGRRSLGMKWMFIGHGRWVDGFNLYLCSVFSIDHLLFEFCRSSMPCKQGRRAHLQGRRKPEHDFGRSQNGARLTRRPRSLQYSWLIDSLIHSQTVTWQPNHKLQCSHKNQTEPDRAFIALLDPSSLQTIMAVLYYILNKGYAASKR